MNDSPRNYTPLDRFDSFQFADALGVSRAQFTRLKKRGMIPLADGRFEHARAHFWTPDAVAATVAHLAKGGDV